MIRIKNGDNMGSIQNGEAQILTFTGQALALAYDQAVCLTLQCQVEDVFVSYSEGGLQNESTRFKISQFASQEESYLVLPFSTPRSGILYFASANVAAASRVVMWQI
mgnify:CR=1 FL=1